MTARKHAPVPDLAAVASRVRDHAHKLVGRAKPARDAALIRQATGEPHPMTRRDLIDLIGRAGQSPEDFDREAAELRNLIAARRILAGRDRAAIEAHDARLAEAHDAAMERATAAAAAVDAEYQSLAEAAREAEEAETQWRLASGKIANPNTPADQRESAQAVLDSFDGNDPGRFAHEARRALVSFAQNDFELNRRRNAAIADAAPDARDLGEWRTQLPGIHKALDVIEQADPRIAELARRVGDPQPEPEPTPEEHAKKVADMARNHRREVEQIQTELAGTGKRASH